MLLLFLLPLRARDRPDRTGPDADTISYLRTREYCAATVAITAAALDISRARDRPDRTGGPVRSLAFAIAALLLLLEYYFIVW